MELGILKGYEIIHAIRIWSIDKESFQLIIVEVLKKAEKQTVLQLGRNVRKKENIKGLSKHRWTCLVSFDG